MLQNMADAAKLEIALDLEKEVFSGFKYESGQVWEKVAPREKETDSENETEEEQHEEEFEEIDEDLSEADVDDDKK